MKAAKLKSELYRMVDLLNGESLSEAYGILVNHVNSLQSNDHWGSLNEGEKIAIEEGLLQIKLGQTIPHDEVMTSLKSKYSK